MTPSTSAAPEAGATSSLYVGLRLFGLLVLVLMLASIGYSAWIAAANWNAIGV